MDGTIRTLEINELKARILLYDLERTALRRELESAKTGNERRAEIHRRRPRMELEHIEALNDVRWLETEERLGRPDTRRAISIAI
jgi:hypothetical protein